MAVSRLGRRTKVIAGALAVLVCLAALGSYLYLRYVDVARFSAEHGRITVDAAPAGPLGPVLVTNKGFALYLFAPDAARRVTCTGGCAADWPPLLVQPGQTVAAGPGVRPGLLGPGGGSQVLAPHGSRESGHQGGQRFPLRQESGVDARGQAWR